MNQLELSQNFILSMYKGVESFGITQQLSTDF
jgi:hypothetical protein